MLLFKTTNVPCLVETSSRLLHTLGRIFAISMKGDNFSAFPFDFFSEKGSALKGKNLPPWEQILLCFRVDTYLTVTSPERVSVPHNLHHSGYSASTNLKFF